MAGADWSRGARLKRKLEAIDADPLQTKMTNYFQIADKIEYLARENQKLSALLKESFATLSNDSIKSKEIGPILHQMLLTVERNSNKSACQRRHTILLKKFATVLYIYAGSMAYEFIQRNMPEALPSLRTVQREVQAEYVHIEEGKFRFDELVQHISKHNAPYVVAVAEDAT